MTNMYGAYPLRRHLYIWQQAGSKNRNCNRKRRSIIAETLWWSCLFWSCCCKESRISNPMFVCCLSAMPVVGIIYSNPSRCFVQRALCGQQLSWCVKQVDSIGTSDGAWLQLTSRVGASGESDQIPLVRTLTVYCCFTFLYQGVVTRRIFESHTTYNRQSHDAYWRATRRARESHTTYTRQP